ncbi:MAG: response regulator [Elusimicrobia bacterium]|nr:response regulator [Elusimicrobiota bacterium]
MAPTSRPRILLVEDDLGYQELLSTILADRYALSLCSSAEEGMAKLDAEAFDLVICDINLFGMTGLELLDKLHREGKSEGCPVVLCSSQTDPDTRVKAMTLGAAGFVVKPYDIDALLALIATLLSTQ